MKDLMTRKIVLGMLMVLVLAFSVQGIADAADLLLTKESGDRQTKPTGNTFDITFSAAERSNTTPIRNASNQLVTEDGTRINSSGYPVATARNGTEYRLIDSGGLIGSPANLYRAEVPADGDTDDNNYIDAGTTLSTAADTSGLFMTGTTGIGSVIDTNGRAVYTDTDLRIRATGMATPETLGDRYYYNQEAVTITVDNTPDTPGFADAGASAMTFALKGAVAGRTTTSVMEVPGINPNALQGNITLVCNPVGGAGEYTVRITDSTDEDDTPWTGTSGDNPTPTIRTFIEFTLYVTLPDAGRTAITLIGDGRYLSSGTNPEAVNTRFNFASNEQIHYQVTKGNGTLYVGNLDTQYTTPAKDLETHESSSVYIIMNNTTNEVTVTYAGQDPATHGRKIVFVYTGTGAPTNNQQQNQQQQNQQQQARLLVSVSGEGTTRSVTVSAINEAGTAITGIGVVLSSPDFTLSQAATTGTPVSITVPSTAGSYSIFARHPTNAYAPGTATVTVAGPALGTLTISPSGVPVNGVQNVTITLRTADNTIPSGTVPVSLSGTGFSPTSVPVTGGFAITGVVLPATTGTYTLNATATGYDPASIRLTVGTPTTTPTTQPGTTPTTRGPAGTPSSVRIASEPFPSGTANRQLAQPLSARVLDANGNGVASVRVTFQVVSGQGRLSQRGNGRAVRVLTDRNGNARTNYTPLADGTSTVRATAAGVTQTVTFTITAGAGAPSTGTTTPRDTGTTTPRTEINPDVHVRAAQRPPMLWVDGGKIYALVGADVEEFGSGVEGAMNITIGGGKVYWTEQTGDSAGTINSANLNGSNVKELKSIMAVPMGIAVSGGKLYWTNSRGRIQSLNADGSGRVENVMLDLPGPRDIAVARGNLYWTQYDATTGTGAIGITNTAGRGTPKSISTGSDMPGSIVIGGNKVYWTEMTGTSSGTINSANLNGTNAMELASIRAVPMGIGVDTARSKLYWTNSRGRVQSANLNGSKIENIVDGLGNPGDMVLSNSITAPVAGGTSSGSGTTASKKYDVNGDGVVDGKDKVLVLEAVMAGTYVAKYDVNNDKQLNILDYVLVDVEADGGAAGAPALLGMKMSAVQIDRLQEQIDLLIATGDRSPAAMRTLIYLQQLIAMARPEKTQLLANYPNPFNPETWIPYELATDTNVRITIYNTQGVVVRTLELGHQSSGYYTGRDRAAYWDGRNAVGEQVASGIYFYQFETDEMSSMRKMVILK